MLTKVPLYAQIQAFVRDGIEAGRFARGDRLPSEPELARRFDTTRATVARAFHQLAFEGLVERRIGSGTFVARRDAVDRLDTTALESHEEHVLASGTTLEYRVLRFAARAASADAAHALGLPSDARVWRLERVRVVARRPLAVEVRDLPLAIGEAIRREWLEQSTIQDVLQRDLGLRIASIENAVRAVHGSARIVAALEVPRTMPLLVRTHTIIGDGARPLLFGETFYPSHFNIRYRLQAR
jgi:GntR family transcriptional regulator